MLHKGRGKLSCLLNRECPFSIGFNQWLDRKTCHHLKGFKPLLLHI